MTERAKKAAQKARSKRDKAILDAIPTSWLDPLLSGPEKIAAPPYTCTDVERLLRAVRDRVKVIMEPSR